jgi:hypothetical protein
MKLARVAILVVLGVGGAGCSTGGGPPFAVGTARTPQPSTTCPFGVRGARVRMIDTADGVVVTLRAFGDIAVLRRRARDAAAMYGPGAHRGLGHDGAHGGGHRHGLGLAQLGVPVEATAEDTEEGARIIVRPKDPADLGRMRAALRARAGRARVGECP